MSCLPYLLSNLEDRNSDVRKTANDAVLGFMIHIGYGPMTNAAEKLKVLYFFVLLVFFILTSS